MNRIFINKKCLRRSFTTAVSVEFTIISTVLLFFSLENDFGIKLDSLLEKFLAIIIPIVFAGLYSVIKTCAFNKNRILEETQCSITLRYGNLLKYAFSTFDKRKRIVVINVNTAFDVIVDPPGTHNPLVSATTIHGQWLEHMKKRGIEPEEINKAIEKDLKDQNVISKRTVQKSRGNTKLYPRGTVARYLYGNTTFFLVALSEFDENNMAQNNQEQLRETILKLIQFIDRCNQGFDVYIPVMGAGRSRTGIDEQSALELLTAMLRLHRSNLHGNINVVVYEKHRDKVAIEW